MHDTSTPTSRCRATHRGPSNTTASATQSRKHVGRSHCLASTQARGGPNNGNLQLIPLHYCDSHSAILPKARRVVWETTAASLLDRYERGALTRRESIQAIAMFATTGVTSAAGAQGNA